MGIGKKLITVTPKLDIDGKVFVPEIESVVAISDINPPPTLGESKQANESQVAQGQDVIGSTMRSFLVTSTNWGAPSAERKLDSYEIGNLSVGQYDDFLDLAAKYWTLEPQEASALGTIRFLNKSLKSSAAMNVPFSMVVGQPVYNPAPQVDNFSEPNMLFEVQQGVKLFADKGQFMGGSPTQQANAPKLYMPSKWKALLIGNADPTTVDYNPDSLGVFKEYVKYDYFAFNVPLPHSLRELEKLTFAGQHYASIKPEYNFYISEYERTIKNTPELATLSERSLPNLYAIMMEKENEKSNLHFHNHITLGNTLKSHEAGSIDGANKNKFDIKKHSSQYFSAFARSLTSALSGKATPSVPITGNKFKNIIVPADSLSKLKDISDRKEMFPAFVDVEISMDKTTSFVDILKETYLLDRFVLEISKAVVTSKEFEEREFVDARETVLLVGEEAVPERSASTVGASLKTWDITERLQKISLIDFQTGTYNPQGSTEEDSTFLSKALVLDDGTIEQLQMMEPKNKFFQSLMGVVFLSKLKEFLKNRFRTYEDLMRGKTNYSETVLYRVEKWATDSSGEASGVEALQNYWIPNDSAMDVAHIVDTQVKYGERYKYVIYAYQMVVASKYAYSGVQVEDSTASMVVTQTPNVMMVEQEVYSETHIIMDSPPVPPEAQIIPYRSNEYELLINLNSAVGDYLLQPVIFSADEAEDIFKIRAAQKLDAVEPVRYKNDDAIGEGGHFEINRLVNHPTSWEDFAVGPHATVANSPEFGSATLASSAAFLDKVRPNVKYYYMFRVMDSHGHMSNPTEMYEVELVSDKGSVYFTKRVVDFATKEPRLPSKPMRRMIEIKPAFEQTLVTDDPSDDHESALDVKHISLGQDVSPWGKRYKFRFISKKTGRKIDLNVTCKIKVEKGLPEGK